MSDALKNKHCTPCEGGTQPLDRARVQSLLKKLESDWSVEQGINLIAEFNFKDYYETTAFVNAVAWIAHREDHHPDISFGYKQCTVRYTTHAIGGLSENDFICAAKIDDLISQ